MYTTILFRVVSLGTVYISRCIFPSAVNGNCVLSRECITD